MIQQTHKADLFKQQMQDSLERETRNSRSIRVAKNDNIYTCGDRNENVYFIKSGHIKLVTLSPAGKECLLDIYGNGDVFGEMCLSGLGLRQESATAMEETFIKEIPYSKFFSRLAADSLLEGFIRYLTVRISDQQDLISNLVTVDSEQRLGKTLLNLARKLGKKDPLNVRIEHRITHEELSGMVGTTRPRISSFMKKFMKLNLIEINPQHFIIVKEQRLSNYLAQIG
jgi:CRP/FNR family cyclic AMP-dependent transcriptional regulator